MTADVLAALKRSHPEAVFLNRVLHAKLPPPVVQFQAVPGRKWAWDAAWPAHMVLVEIQGGGWIAGRHHRPAGYDADLRKGHAATLLGYRCFSFTPTQVEEGYAVDVLRQALSGQRVLTA